MFIRKFHRILGLCFAPFFLITAVTGALLLWRKAGIYDVRIVRNLLGWHNWEGLYSYIGVALAAALTLMVLTGAGMWIQIISRKFKRSKP